MKRLGICCRLFAAVLVMACGGVLAEDARTEYAKATDRVIVRLKGGAPARTFSPAARDALAARMSARLGEELRAHRVMGDGAQVLRLPRRFPHEEIRRLGSRFANDPEILEIVPDRVFFPAITPNDPQFDQQWALGAANGINAPAAWDITTGASNLIVAIIDTGKLPHVDLAGRWIGGYDFVGCAGRSPEQGGSCPERENDFDPQQPNDPNRGPDPDAGDPGDWVTPGEAASGALAGCPVAHSSWHGTAMAGVIGAAASNGFGIAGINWNSKLLPVRVVGKCGGYESDIADGIRWAVGIAVPDIPSNPDTADVVNLSLSAAGSCGAILQSAVTEAVAAGVSIIAAAGNHAAAASAYAPANCAGVITVGAVDRNGGKPAYSNFGAPIALSAPGGRATISGGTPAQDWVLTTSDSGVLDQGDLIRKQAAHDGLIAAVNGTSIAAAHVTGIASLMLSVNPSLQPTFVRDILQNTAGGFPANTIDLGSQGDCTTALCGNGILAAARAVEAASQWGRARPMVAVGQFSAYALRSDGTVEAWGDNEVGQLGNGTGVATLLPVRIPALSGVTAVAAGYFNGFAIKADGSLWAWGAGGVIGDGTSIHRMAPVIVPGISHVVAVAGGSAHALAVTSDGAVWSWGQFPLGTGTDDSSLSPVRVPDIANIVSVSAETGRSFALRSDGTVWAWGALQPLPPSLAPTLVEGLSEIVEISAGALHLLARRADGTVLAVGDNRFGQLGDGTFVDSTMPVTAQISGVVRIWAGTHHSFALKGDGTLWAWGRNDAGQLGDSSLAHRGVPVRVFSLNGASGIGARNAWSVAVKPDGSVLGWGLNPNAGVGDGTSLRRTSPVFVLNEGGSAPLDVGVEDGSQFAPRTDVTMASWVISNQITHRGSAPAEVTVLNGLYSIGCREPFTSEPGVVQSGETVCIRHMSAPSCGVSSRATLGISGSAPRFFDVSTIACDHVPDAFEFLTLAGVEPGSVVVSNAVTVAGVNVPVPVWIEQGDYSIGCAGSFSASASMISPGDSVCARVAAPGQPNSLASARLGVGTETAAFHVMTAPHAGFSVAPSIAGGGASAYALRSDGIVLAWGDNQFGQIGNGSLDGRTTPGLVPGLTGVVAIGAGSRAAYAVRADGTLWAWGRNEAGALGDGTVLDRRRPALIPAPAMVAVSGGYGHGLALAADQSVWSWGDNERGQLGTGSAARRLTPARVPGLSAITAIGAGRERHWPYSLALAADGRVWRWGDAPGAATLTPQVIEGLLNVVEVAAGGRHLLARRSDGTVWAIGDNAQGQLGDGTFSTSHSPVQVSGLPAVVRIAAGSEHSVALDVSGRVWAWGRNSEGQLGNGSTNVQPTPVQIPETGAVASISAGDAFTLALRSDGTMVAWGANASGQLGAGNTSARTSPAQVLGVDGVGFLTLGPGSQSFVPQSEVPISSLRISNSLTFTGIAGTALVQISGGEYSVGCSGVFTAAAGAISSGQSICVRLLSADACGTARQATLTIESVGAFAFIVTTQSCNQTPLPFAFATRANVAPGETTTSESIVIGGLTGQAPISIADGSYSIGCQNFTAATGLVSNGDVVCVRRTAALTADTLTTAILTVGTFSAPFHVITAPAADFTVTPSVAAGFLWGMGLRSDGVLFTWGYNFYGTLADGSSQLRALPKAVSNLSGVRAIAAGAYSGYAIRSDGRLWAWGRNNSGQLGDGTSLDRSRPVMIPGITDVSAIASGEDYAVALRANGTVWTWGSNSSGQLGAGFFGGTRLTPAVVAGIPPIVAIAAGSSNRYVIALDQAGDVWAWGNAPGYPGLTTSVPLKLDGLGNIVEISAGGLHVLARDSSGAVWAVGANAAGQIGDGTTTNKTSPVRVIDHGVISISAVASSSFAIHGNQVVTAWGANYSGQLGDGSRAGRLLPVAISALAGATQIAGDPHYGIALKADGSVLAWGQNGQGNLGDGSFEPRTGPAPVLSASADGYLSLLRIDTYPDPYFFLSAFDVPPGTQAISNEITVRGLAPGVASPIEIIGGEYSVRGSPFGAAPGTVTNADVVVVRVLSSSLPSGLASASLRIGGANGRVATFHVRTRTEATSGSIPAVAAGNAHTLLLDAEGVASAAGSNGNGQLGNGSTLGLSRFAPVAGLSGIISIAAGDFHSLALRSDGTVLSWGANAFGQLGRGPGSAVDPYSDVVPGVPNARYLSAGTYHSGAVNAGGRLWMWGLNVEGQAGIGSSEPVVMAPVEVPGVVDVVSVAAGGRHTLALLVDGTVRAWGANESGQLGDGTTTLRRSPVPVSGLAGVVAIAAGDAQSIAIRADGSVVAWGFNGFGQLGDGTTINRSTPVPVPSLGTGVGLIAAGANHSMAVKVGGALYTWGNNANSQLGNGNNTNSSVPTLLAAPTRVVAISAGARHSAAIDADRKLHVWGDNFFGQVGNRSGNYNPHSASLNVLRGDSVISEGTSGAASGVGTGSNSGSSVLEIDGQATSFDFGPLSAGAAKTTIGKYANQSASENINGIALDVTGAGFSLQTHNCPATLGPDQVCTFTIGFSPGAAASYSGELVVTSSVVGSPERRSLVGTGVASAAIAFAKAGVDFPPQTVGASSSPASLTLTNTGSGTLNVSSITSSLADFAATHDCGSIAPGGTCALSITFTPAAASGRSGYLTIASNASGTPHTVTVSGTGVATQLASHTLTVNKAGAGTGTVTSSTGGINCGATCVASFTSGTVVTLTATPGPSAAFAGWSGDACTGASTCQVTMNAAVTVTATFNSTATVPGAPQNLQASGGNAQATFTFSAPASNGGSAITGYTVTCTAAGATTRTGTNAASPITVSSLSNGVTYSCSATATNAIGTGPASSAVNVTPAAPVSFVSAKSRKTHGANTFELPIDASQPLSGAVTVESRAIGAGHVIVMQFNGPVVVAGTATVTAPNGSLLGAASTTISGNNVLVTITGVPDLQRATISLAGVNNASSAAVSVGFFVGDVNSSRAVTATDILRVKGQRGVTPTGGISLYDVNTSGAIDDTDVALLKANVGREL